MTLQNASEKLLAGIAIVAIAAWAGSQGLSAARESRWRAAQRDGAPSILELGAEASNLTLAERRGFANALANSIFPPQHETAAAQLALAIPRDPLSSDLWHDLAKENLLLGRPDRARICLERSDALDPRYPEQRFDAINLWTLLGEPERAASIARRIADFGGKYREDAARRLFECGLAPGEIFKGLGGPELPPAEQLGVISTLLADLPDGKAEAAELFAAAKLESLEALRQVSAAARLAAENGVHSAAVDFWKKARPDVELIDGLVPAHNLALRTTPLLDPFYFGWQLPESSAEPVTRWRSRDADSIHHPEYLQFQFFQGRTKRGYMLKFYRLPFPANVSARLRVPVRLIPADRSECSLLVMAGGKEIAAAAASPLNGAWQVLEIEIAAAAEPRVVELALRRVERLAGQAASAQAEVRLGGIGLRASAERGAP